MMKAKNNGATSVQQLCRKLKIQLEELAVTLERELPVEEQSRRSKLMEQLKQQLAELS
jgi:hypothetical protein